MSQPQSDPFLDALDAAQRPAVDPFLSALDAAQGAKPPADNRSMFARAYDVLFTPPEFVTNAAKSVADYIDAPSLEGSKLGAQLRGFTAGAVQGVGSLLTPGDIALLATGPVGRAARAPEAFAEVVRAANAATAVRGAERMIDAQSGREGAAGLAQAALGLAGVRAPEPHAVIETPREVRGELPPGVRFVATPHGDVAPRGTEIPMERSADGSFVRGVPAEYARHEVRGELPAGPRFVAGEGGIVGDTATGDDVLAALDRAQGRAPVPSPAESAGEASVRTVPAAIADREIDPTVPARQAIRVRQYSGDVEATDAPFINDEQRGMLQRMKADLETFQPVRGRLVRSEGSAVKDTYSYGAAGSAVSDDVRTISEQNVGNDKIIAAIEDVLAGKKPTNRLHTAVIDAAQGYIEKRPGYRGPEITAEAAARTGPREDADFEKFSQEWDAIAGEGDNGGGPGEAGFTTPEFLTRAAGGAIGGAIGAGGGDENESPIRKAARIALGAAVGAAAPSLLRGRGGAAAARVAETAVPRLAPQVVTEAAPRVRAYRSGEPMRDPMAGLDPLFNKLNPLVRDGVAKVIADNNGFAGQRRGEIGARALGKFANEIRVNVEQTLPKGTAANSETITALARALQKTTQRVSELSTLVNSGRATDADVVALQVAIQEQKVVATSFMGARSEAGRTLAALNFWGGVLDSGDVDLIRKAAAPIKEEAARIAKGIAQLPDDPLTRFRWLQDQQRVSPWSYLRTYYLANLLSGPLTQVRNTIGNLSNAIADVATLPAAAGIDAAKSAIGGTPRAVRLSELKPTIAGSLVGLEKGWSDAMFALRNGLNPATLSRSLEAAVTHGKLDLPAPELPGGGANPLNWSFRAMTAADALARTTAYEGELSAILFNQAKNEGLSGQRLLDRVAQLRAGMEPDNVALRTQAANYAARRVFLEEPGDITKRVTLLAQSIPGSYFVLPFIKISSAIARQGAEFSPLGFMMREAQRGGRAGTQAQARATAGTLAAGYLFWLAASGRISGDGPSDSTERNALYEKGWRPNSVKLGDRWYGYQAVSPLNIPMAAIANAVEAWRYQGEKPQTVPDVLSQSFARLSNTFLESTFLQGAFNLVEALKDPERNAARFFGQTATGLIPGSSALRTIQRATDPVQRQPSGVVENVEAGLPGLSKHLPPRVTRFGEEVTRDGGPVQRAIDPFMSSSEKQDPIADELDRLHVDLTVPAGRLTVNGEPLTREEGQALKVKQGQAVRAALETLINGAGYAKLTDEQRAAAIKKQIGRTRARVNEEFRRETQAARARGGAPVASAEGMPRTRQPRRALTPAQLRSVAAGKFGGALKGPMTREEIQALADMMTEDAHRPVSYREARAAAIQNGVQVGD